jgi:hypothetical protein
MATYTNRERQFLVRFAVGDERGIRSSVWRIWKGREKDDIYIAPRAAANFVKGSLHASGLCYFSITSEHYAQMSAAGTARKTRALTRWQRPVTPTAGLVKVVSIVFAAEFLSQNYVPVAREDTLLIDSPKLGQAIVVDLLFGRTPRGRFFPLSNQRELGRAMLSTGEEFLLIAGLVDDFDAQSFQKHHQPVPETTEIGFFQEQLDVQSDDLRGAILLPAIRDGMLRIVEIGPAFITRG